MRRNGIINTSKTIPRKRMESVKRSPQVHKARKLKDLKREKADQQKLRLLLDRVRNLRTM